MVIKKEGIPEEGEIVQCTVNKILYHAIFVTLDEYSNREAMVHISEIAPGRIRNIRDYVKEGKKLVCVVLRVSLDKKQIDLSLRRVSTTDRIKKIEAVRQEQKAEKILEAVAIKLKIPYEEMLSKYAKPIIENYGSIFACFQDISANGESILEELGFPKEITMTMSEVVKERIKPPEIETRGVLLLTSYSDNGINDIKDSLNSGLEFAKSKHIKASLNYLGAPRYSLQVTAGDYKKGEENLRLVSSTIIDSLKKRNGSAELQKKDK